MGGSSRRLRLCSGVALSALFLVVGASGIAQRPERDRRADQGAAGPGRSADAHRQGTERGADAHRRRRQGGEEAGEPGGRQFGAGQGNRGRCPCKVDQNPGKGGMGRTRQQRSLFPRTQAGQRPHILYARRRDHRLRPIRRLARRVDEGCQGGPGRPGRQHAGRKLRLDARHLDQHLLSGRARLPAHPRSILQFRLPVRSRHRHFGGGRHETVEQQPQQPGQRLAYSAATATSDLPRRTGAPSRSARSTRPTRTRPRCSIRSPACRATTRRSWATRAATTASSSAPGSATRSGTNRRPSAAASSSTCCSRRARTAPTTAAISPRANPIAPATTIRTAAPIRWRRAATVRSAMRSAPISATQTVRST